MNKKRIIIVGVVVVAVLVGAAATAYFLTRSESNKSADQTAKPGTVSQETASSIDSASKNGNSRN